MVFGQLCGNANDENPGSARTRGGLFGGVGNHGFPLVLQRFLVRPQGFPWRSAAGTGGGGGGVRTIEIAKVLVFKWFSSFLVNYPEMRPIGISARRATMEKYCIFKRCSGISL